MSNIQGACRQEIETPLLCEQQKLENIVRQRSCGSEALTDVPPLDSTPSFSFCLSMRSANEALDE